MRPLRLQVHLAQQRVEPRISADRIEECVTLDRHQQRSHSSTARLSHSKAASISPSPRWIQARLVGGTYPWAALQVKALQQSAGLGCIAAQPQCEAQPAHHGWGLPGRFHCPAVGCNRFFEDSLVPVSASDGEMGPVGSWIEFEHLSGCLQRPSHAGARSTASGPSQVRMNRDSGSDCNANSTSADGFLDTALWHQPAHRIAEPDDGGRRVQFVTREPFPGGPRASCIRAVLRNWPSKAWVSARVLSISMRAVRELSRRQTLLRGRIKPRKPMYQ